MTAWKRTPLGPFDQAILAVLKDCTASEHAGYAWIGVPALVEEVIGSLAWEHVFPDATAMELLVPLAKRYDRARGALARLEGAGLAESRRDAGRVKFRAARQNTAEPLDNTGI